LELDLIVCFGCLDIKNEYFTILRKKISAQLTGKIKLNFIDLKIKFETKTTMRDLSAQEMSN
jgi:hypothetical protein